MRLWHVIVLFQPGVALGEHFSRGKACECGHVKVGLIGVQCETPLSPRFANDKNGIRRLA